MRYESRRFEACRRTHSTFVPDGKIYAKRTRWYCIGGLAARRWPGSQRCPIVTIAPAAPPPERVRARGERMRGTVRGRFVRRKGDWPCACTAARCATSASRRKGGPSCAARAGRRRSSPAAIACTLWGIGRRRSRRPNARRATRSPAASPAAIAGPTWPMPCGRSSAPCRAGTAESCAPIRAVGATGRAAPRTRLAGSRFWRRGPRGRASASIGPVPACIGFEGFGSVFRRGEEGL